MTCADLAECTGCPVQGACCYFTRTLPDGRVEQTAVPCPFLDLSTKLCRVYERRLEVPWCSMAGTGPLPLGCIHPAAATVDSRLEPSTGVQ